MENNTQPTLGLAIDFNPGHDSELKDAPVTWCKSKLGIETKPSQWKYTGWGIYECMQPIITQAQWDDISKNWSSKYEGFARGLQLIRL